MLDEVRISVRPLVEYVFKTGSIETGFRSSASMTEGTKAHQQIQKNYQEQDRKEVYLHTELECGGISFKLDGRCDGILQEDGTVIIDEIKSTKQDIGLLEEDAYEVHWAQAKCYAYMYAKDRELPGIIVQLTYVQLPEGKQRVFRKRYSKADLEGFIFSVIKTYLPYARLRLEHTEERNGSIGRMEFPFESYRKGQRHFAGAVYKTIAEGKNLYADAPTGIGKTISTVFPALKAMGGGQAKRFFYLTAKTITRQAAEDALAILEKKGGLKLYAVTITAKEKVCLNEKLSCNKENCEFANGYYDRINGAVLDILENETRMGRKTIEEYALKHKVCPFEFSLDLAYACDAVICDYNYIFDPKVNLKRLVDEQKKETVLLVDEAHNLVERARSMFSAQINKSDFLSIKREYKERNPSVYKSAKDINDFFIRIKKELPESGFQVMQEMNDDLLILLEDFLERAEAVLAGRQTGEPDEALLQTYFSAADFIRITKLFNQDFIFLSYKEKSDTFVKLLCMDPSDLLMKMGKNFKSKIFFSATLQPMKFYTSMLGMNEEDFILSIPSPFAKEQAAVSIYPVSTRFLDREKSIQPIASSITRFIGAKKGNYLIFFPSYKYMNDVLTVLTAEHYEGKILVQNPDMSEEEREAFLESFQEVSDESLAGFAVLGGIFSEGIDLKGDRLNGVAIVGVGLPGISLERDLMKHYFSAQGRNGYDYAYVFPGMNKILQAGGRLIRSENDSGRILLIDDRYLTKKYLAMLPELWQDFRVISSSS
ncbi:helicase C-terminal domain-containing protein [Peribacillus kribbensis]|uniref:helicase C-terminal domain-containing protein n=1 Tax=Peribacillus kribbensis TaxID=356658 RepID=UPI0004205C83|nr:helicase C-terminal domain-containing protein [Peribacillus kribbensis]